MWVREAPAGKMVLRAHKAQVLGQVEAESIQNVSWIFQYVQTTGLRATAPDSSGFVISGFGVASI